MRVLSTLLFLLLLAPVAPITPVAQAGLFEGDCNKLKAAAKQYGVSTTRFNLANRHFKTGIPKSSVVYGKEVAAWSGYWWPYKAGGIATRWGASSQTKYVPYYRGKRAGPTLSKEKIRAKVKKMTKAQRDQLSPAEKLDLFLGLDGKLADIELRQRGPELRNVQSWFGFCNGLCAASILTKEPRKQVKVKNKDGVEITFFPSDLKALASAAYFYPERVKDIGLLRRVGAKAEFDYSPNAAVFDKAITELLGKEKQPFAVQMDRTWKEVWNYVAVGYERRIVTDVETVTAAERKREKLPASAVQKVKVEMDLLLLDGISPGEYERGTSTKTFVTNNSTPQPYQYTLFMNAKGEVVDGRYIYTTPGKHAAPGLIWFPAGKGADFKIGVNDHLDFKVISNLIDKAQ